MLRFFPDAAGIDEDEVRLPWVFRLQKRGILKETEHPLRIVLIHLTAVGFNIDTLFHIQIQ